MGTPQTNWEAVCKDMWSYLLQELGVHMKSADPVALANGTHPGVFAQKALEYLVLRVEKHTTGTADFSDPTDPTVLPSPNSPTEEGE